jgi:hypothetical protein
MESEIQNKLTVLEQKIDAIYISVEKTRKYFQWTMIVTLVALVLPMIGLLFVVPAFLTSYSSALEGL